MAYESDRATTILAVAAATEAAIILRRPAAWSIVATLGLLVSNPGDMKKAAGEWRDPNAGPAADLVAIRDQLHTLQARIKDEGHWEGDAYETFSASVKDFNAQLDNARRYRQGMGDTLDQTADIYHVGAQIAFYTALTMEGIALVYMASYVYPALRIPAEGWVTAALKKLDDVVKGVVGKKLKAVAAVGVIMWMLNGFQKDQQRMFWGTQAMPQQEPDFTQVSLEYDKNGGLVRKPENPALNLPKTKGSSPLSIIGL
ncbi:hypothetical protein [Streptosporangium sp. NPDC051022]|uniref:WXG100 family type VII secretion target n=1 Tax=Streptosporangium sp. NPDC051022 TaxID=3155752 RepID=UPI00342A1DDF